MSLLTRAKVPSCASWGLGRALGLEGLRGALGVQDPVFRILFRVDVFRVPVYKVVGHSLLPVDERLGVLSHGFLFNSNGNINFTNSKI